MHARSPDIRHEREDAIAHWQWLGVQVRTGIASTSPALIRQFLDAGERLIAYGRLPWQIHESHLSLLLTTISDASVPASWRECCLDQCYRPLALLRSLSMCGCMERRCREWAWHLANVSIG